MSCSANNMRGSKPHLFLVLAAILTNALVVFLAIPYWADTLSAHYGLNQFPDDYDKLARNLVNGAGYRFAPDTAETLMREPGYPFFLAAVFTLSPTLAAAKMANMFLVTVIAWLMFFLTRRLVPGPAWLAPVAVCLVLLHPGIILAESRGGFEILFIALLLLFVAAMLRAIKVDTVLAYALAGIVLGLATLVKGTLLLLPVFLIPYLLMTRQPGQSAGRVLKRALLLCTGMLIVLTPWVVRNYVVADAFVPTATVLGVAAHTGQYVCQNHTLRSRLQDVDAQSADMRARFASERGYSFQRQYFLYFYSPKDELRFNQELLRDVTRNYVESPMLFAKCVSANLFYFWFAGKSWNITLANIAIQLPYLVLAVFGGAALWRTEYWRESGALMLIIVYYVALHLPIFAQARYSMPLIPALAILATAGAWSLGNAWGRRMGPGFIFGERHG